MKRKKQREGMKSATEVGKGGHVESHRNEGTRRKPRQKKEDGNRSEGKATQERGEKERPWSREIIGAKGRPTGKGTQQGKRENGEIVSS
jgi:hypothetical protein